MSTTGRFITLVCTMIGGGAILMGGLLACFRLLWAIQREWNTTNNILTNLLKTNEQEHAGFRAEDERLWSRFDRHEEVWHGKHRRT